MQKNTSLYITSNYTTEEVVCIDEIVISW